MHLYNTDGTEPSKYSNYAILPRSRYSSSAKLGWQISPFRLHDLVSPFHLHDPGVRPSPFFHAHSEYGPTILPHCHIIAPALHSAYMNQASASFSTRFTFGYWHRSSNTFNSAALHAGATVHKSSRADVRASTSVQLKTQSKTQF